jgi:hypothetical protein
MNHFGKFVNRFQLKQRSKLSQAASMRKPLPASATDQQCNNKQTDKKLKIQWQ